MWSRSRVFASLCAPCPRKSPSRTVGLGAALQRPHRAVVFRVGRESAADGYVGTRNTMYLLRLLGLRCRVKHLKLWSREGVNLGDLFFPLFSKMYSDGIGCSCPHHPRCQILSKPSEIGTSFTLTVQTMTYYSPSRQVSAEARTNWAFQMHIDADEMNTRGKLARGAEEEPSMEKTSRE